MKGGKNWNHEEHAFQEKLQTPRLPPSTFRLRPFAFRLLLVWLPVGYLLIVVVMMFLENSLIFFPTPYPDGDWQPREISPQDAWFQAADGTRLHGWYLPHHNPRAVVLFCHGNAGNISYRAEMLRALHDLVGVSVLIFDYRGYGRSEGKPDEAGILQAARAARPWRASRAGSEPRAGGLLGRARGGAGAGDWATEWDAERADDAGVKALVLESAFTSIPDVAAYYYPWLPVRILIRNKFDSLAKISAYHGPLLQSHGDSDTIIPYRFGRRLFEAANEPKQFITIVGRDHNDPQSKEYYDALAAFLKDLD